VVDVVGAEDGAVGADVGDALAVVGAVEGVLVVVRGWDGFDEADGLGRDDAVVEVAVGPLVVVAAGNRPTSCSTASSTRAASASRSSPAARALTTAAFMLRRSARAAAYR
jgi:hypothetical protein